MFVIENAFSGEKIIFAFESSTRASPCIRSLSLSLLPSVSLSLSPSHPLALRSLRLPHPLPPLPPSLPLTTTPPPLWGGTAREYTYRQSLFSDPTVRMPRTHVIPSRSKPVRDQNHAPDQKYKESRSDEMSKKLSVAIDYDRAKQGQRRADTKTYRRSSQVVTT